MDSPEKIKRNKELASKWLDGTITHDEEKEYAEWYNYENGLPLYIPESFAKSEHEHESRMLHRILPVKGKVMPFRSLWRAASILLVLGMGIMGWLMFKPGKPVISVQSSQDIFPAQGGVTLVLGNGDKILLDTVNNGKLFAAKTENITKQENSLSYVENRSETLVYNKIVTSKGKTYMLRLADGSTIWLDAESSVRFPTSFPAKERVVEITGQVYVDVAKNAKIPFKLITGDQTVEVLGTEFNVSNYSNDIRTTLINGSVKINNTLLKPFEQAVNNQGVLLVKKKIDVAEITAWKNGEFRFNGASLQEIMQQLQRWYDIEVEYENKIPEMQLVAKIGRDMPVSKILHLMELTGQVRFIINKNKIKVMSIKK